MAGKKKKRNFYNVLLMAGKEKEEKEHLQCAFKG